jgi:inner membrane protein
MTGKTHYACGTAVALLLTAPSSPRALLICLGAAAVGSVISDVDVTTSQSHRDLVRIVSTAGGAALVTWAVNTIFNLQLERFLLRYTSALQLCAWLILFLGLCVFGTTQPHRSFMHSLPGMALLTLCVWWGAEPFAVPFCVAMGSHILLDLFNRRQVRLLYPLRWGVAFRLCSSHGVVDKVLCGVGSALTVMGLVLAALRFV